MDEQFIGERITQLRLSINKSEREMSLDLGHSGSYINSITKLIRQVRGIVGKEG